jgi:hypothetical protein
MAERLTYLLGICVAVISWSVTQLSASLSNDEVIGYRVETSAVDEKSDATILHLENLSRTKASERIVISNEVNYRESQAGENCEKRELSYYPLSLAVPNKSDSNKNGFVNVGVPTLPPGASLDVYTKYPHGCVIVPSVQLGNDQASQGLIEKPRARLLRFGMETWVISNRFAIIITLIAIFGVVFAIAFAVAIGIARRAPA